MLNLTEAFQETGSCRQCCSARLARRAQALATAWRAQRARRRPRRRPPRRQGRERSRGRRGGRAVDELLFAPARCSPSAPTSSAASSELAGARSIASEPSRAQLDLLFDGDSRTGVVFAATAAAVVRALTMIDEVFDAEIDSS